MYLPDGSRIPLSTRTSGLPDPHTRGIFDILLCWYADLTITTQELENERKTFYTEKEKEHAWTETAKVVEIYSDNTVKRWKEEIDTHLVFVSAQCSIYPLTTADAHNAGRSLFGRRYGIQRPIISTSTTPCHRPYSSSVADDFTPTGKF